MKTQKKKTELNFAKSEIVELNRGDLNAVFGGTFSTNSESGPLCDMADIIIKAFTR
ncbi:hypothetical protein N7U66_12720 [Lacinutrix neustonica]|uniref:Uncharacterized protein n=1 Tax=Lacinutrix neustonica TaxID=2980107 RepID=A0A9E8SC91_9FLAO|nr:hypothetical protein [Lacinutrix neustonica]WAC01038.1 hypothetical protein N7U66_12720 [Lacinutrix neustonica]